MSWILEDMNGNTLHVHFEYLTREDTDSFSTANGWEEGFHWEVYLAQGSSFEAFKLVDKHGYIHGCIAYRKDFDNLFVEVALVEKAPIHRRGSLYINVGKILLAQAYKTSFDCQFDGYVVLTPKSKLIEYYTNVYRATFIGNVNHHPRYLLDPAVGRSLIVLYYKH
ncbi:hypothetical protein [Paenibacillus sp. WLX2291]|uniref:hypothetical protein n=1 Tax=Paenibacillus sp. WLX2291 TaxID=3296934 RepID=UPI0039841FD3